MSKWSRVYVERILSKDNRYDQSNSLLMQPIVSDLVGEWFLIMVGGATLAKPLVIRFLENILSFDYCNNVNLNYERKGSTVLVTNGFSTLKVCPWMVPYEPTIVKQFKECAYLMFQEYQLQCLDRVGKEALRLLR